MRAALLLCVCLSVAEATGVFGKRLRRSKKRDPEPETAVFAEDDDGVATNSSARELCFRGLVNACQIQGGICVMKGQCRRSARILTAGGCQACTCCTSGPPPPPSCSQTDHCGNSHGICRSACPAGATAMSGLCTAGCTCCVTGCPPTPSCYAQKGKCISTHNVCAGKVTGYCQGYNCVCCVPVIPPPTCSTDHSCHTHHGGICKTHCTNNEKHIYGGCSTLKDCKCCVKGPECPQKKGCDRKNGKCREYCSHDEEHHHEGCGHKGCVCCVPKHYHPKPDYNPQPYKPDYHNPPPKPEYRGGDDGTDGGYGGRGECTASEECLEKSGECKETCDKEEKELEDGCTGDAGCKCCFS